MDFTYDFIITLSILLIYLICFLGVIFYACGPILCPDASKYIENGEGDLNDKSETSSPREYSKNDKTVALVYEELKCFNLLYNSAHTSAKLPTLDLVKKPSILEIS